MEICARVYRPRRARESPLFRLVEQHLEEFLRVYPERFAKQHGPLRPVVERVRRGFLTCGLVEHGFARLWCGTCRTSVLCPFSCRGRSFCPSCEKKKQLLWAEWLQKEVLEPVPHRHVVLTMPRLLRGIFRKRRELLLDLSQCGAEALAEYMRTRVGADTRPGIVVSIATAGDLLQWHPHGHILLTDGAFSDDGAFHPLATWDGDVVMKRFRERLLARLRERRAISEDLVRKLLAWRHPGFSAHVGEAIPFEVKKAIEDVACYMVRAPLSLKKLVYLDGQKAVLYRSRMNPSLGRNFEAMDPLEWLARMADHIPDPGKHRTHFYGFYASRVRASRRETEASDVPTEPTTKRRCSPSGARLISKVYHADPLLCRQCGGKLKIIAYLSDEISVKRILAELGLSPPEDEKPPPVREVVFLPVDDEGRKIQVG
ncbi:MAG TPA: transposase [Thermoanaerobaculia bacterium]|nr:transposase [Thermoanaerobaculia bacterium]